RRRYDRQTVAPPTVDEVAIDLVERALEHDVHRSGLHLDRRRGQRGRQVLDDGLHGDGEDVAAELLTALDVDVARKAGERQIREPEPGRRARPLDQEALADER